VAEPADRPTRRVLVTGATGFIGRHLVQRLLSQGDDVIALSRDPQRASAVLGPQVQCVADLAQLPADTAIEAIVNLAGATILAQPWTRARRLLLRESRLGTTRAVVLLCERLQKRPSVLVNASAIGYYGVRSDEPVDEQTGPQPIFQSQLCSDWEALAARAGPATRVTSLRFGVVLGRHGGALPQLVRATRLGLGTILGTGRQGAPWIHLEDALRLITWALEQPALTGAVNAVAPEAVTQAQMMTALAQILQRPIWLRVPAFVLRAALGEMAQLLVDGQRVVPSRALAAGFAFRHPTLAGALEDILSRR
jgi:hypothetical protein